jgi:diketogulonate reductase-like aldo/keto reductase
MPLNDPLIAIGKAMLEAELKLGRQGIAYVPFFPLGGFTPLQSETLSQIAAKLGAMPMQVALAWLLQRAPNILLSRAHRPSAICGKIWMQRRRF